MRSFNPKSSTLVLIVLLFATSFHVEAQTCKPSGKVRGKKPPPGPCTMEGELCCIEGRSYTTYDCSPPMSSHTKAVLILNGFEEGGDGNKPCKCDGKYHSDDSPIVSFSSGWFDDGKRCFINVTINGNGGSVVAMVLDECDSKMGCDRTHDYLPPCSNNIVMGSKAVWKGLGVPLSQWGKMDITWSLA